MERKRIWYIGLGWAFLFTLGLLVSEEVTLTSRLFVTNLIIGLLIGLVIIKPLRGTRMRMMTPILILAMLLPLTSMTNRLIYAESRIAMRKHGIRADPGFYMPVESIVWFVEDGQLVGRYSSSLNHHPLRIEVEWLVRRMINDCDKMGRTVVETC